MAAYHELELGQFIPPVYHHAMLLDEARVGAFRESINKIVKPGFTVVELGGGTGILSHFAAERDADVWYVERNPKLVQLAKLSLARNRNSHRIRLVQGDAREFTPPVPVDVVICEMLHSGLLREKQLEVIAAFRKNYAASHLTLNPEWKMPRFIPEATLLGLQPVQQDFSFSGFYCPVPIFQDPGHAATSTLTELGDPVVYATIEWRGALPPRFSWRGEVVITKSGELTGIRFITKNLVGIFEEENRSADWLNSHLVMPLLEPISVEMGDRIMISFSYEAGDQIESLGETLRAIPLNKAIPLDIVSLLSSTPASSVSNSHRA